MLHARSIESVVDMICPLSFLTCEATTSKQQTTNFQSCKYPVPTAVFCSTFVPKAVQYAFCLVRDSKIGGGLKWTAAPPLNYYNSYI